MKLKLRTKQIMAVLLLMLMIIGLGNAPITAATKDDSGYKDVCMNSYAIRIGNEIFMQYGIGGEIGKYNIKTKKFTTLFKTKGNKAFYQLQFAYGKYVYYSYSQIKNEKDNFYLYRYDTKTKKSKKITALSNAYSMGSVTLYSKKIYYTYNGDIYRINMNGTGKKKLVKGNGSNCERVVVSQNKLYFTKNKNGQYTYYQCTLKGKSIKEIKIEIYSKASDKVQSRICGMKGEVYILKDNESDVRKWTRLDGKVTYSFDGTLYKNKKKIAEFPQWYAQISPMGDYFTVTELAVTELYGPSGKCLKTWTAQ